MVAAISYIIPYYIIYHIRMCSFLLPRETKKVNMHEAHIEGAEVNSWAKQGEECVKEYKIGGTCSKSVGDKPIQNGILEM